MNGKTKFANKINKAVAALQSIQNAERRLIIAFLTENPEGTVNDICDFVGIYQSKASYHLRLLREAELVEFRRQGRFKKYKIAKKFDVILEFLGNF